MTAFDLHAPHTELSVVGSSVMETGGGGPAGDRGRGEPRLGRGVDRRLVGVRPTNAIGVGERHVWVAAGRDYADVPPLKGVYSGGGSTTLDVQVEVTRLA